MIGRCSTEIYGALHTRGTMENTLLTLRLQWRILNGICHFEHVFENQRTNALSSGVIMSHRSDHEQKRILSQKSIHSIA